MPPHHHPDTGPGDLAQDIEKAELQANRQISRHQSNGASRSRSSSLSSSSTASGSIVSIAHHSITRHRTDRTQPDTQPSGADGLHPLVLERQRTAASIYARTVGAKPERITSKSSIQIWPEFGGGKPYPPFLPHHEKYLVDFAGPDDPLHGQNWPVKKKIFTAMVLGYVTFVCAWGSSIYSSATYAVAAEFNVGLTVALLGVSFYVLGFALGPLFWAPLSELKGRRIPLIIAIFGFSIFQIAVAVSKDIQTLLICRFWGGAFGSAPLSIVGAVFADIFNPAKRGVAVALFSMMVFSGPLFGPIAGGFITSSYLGWRWTEYITGIMGFLGFFLVLFFLEETFPPVILVGKAKHLRRLTKNWGIHAKQEEIEVDFKELITRNLARPMKLLFGEMIILLISIYTAFVYGILYLFLTAYPMVFSQKRQWQPGVANLPYIGMILGMVLGSCLVLAFQPWTNRRMEARGDSTPRPEDRLVPCIIGAIVFPIGLFWFSWSGNFNDVHWMVPTAAGIPLGFGLITIFLQCINYLIDAYLLFAASAIAASTFLRSLVGAAFPLFARFMFADEPLGIGWAGSILGFLAVAMIPIPVLFFLYGENVRKKSKWAPTS